MPCDPYPRRSRDLFDHTRPWEYRRSYVLPAGVLTNIPRHHHPGGYGAHEAARGLLAEVCQNTGARPRALLYSDHEISEPDRPGPITVVTMIALAQLPNGAALCVVTRRRQHRHIDRDGDWSIQLDGTVLASESRRYPPVLPQQGRIVAWHVRSAQKHTTTSGTDDPAQTPVATGRQWVGGQAPRRAASSVSHGTRHAPQPLSPQPVLTVPDFAPDELAKFEANDRNAERAAAFADTACSDAGPFPAGPTAVLNRVPPF